MNCNKCSGNMTEVYGCRYPEVTKCIVMGWYCGTCVVMDLETDPSLAGGQFSAVRRYIDGVLQQAPEEQTGDSRDQAFAKSSLSSEGFFDDEQALGDER